MDTTLSETMDALEATAMKVKAERDEAVEILKEIADCAILFEAKHELSILLDSKVCNFLARL